MIQANEARSLMSQGRQDQLRMIGVKIKEAATSGKSYLTVTSEKSAAEEFTKSLITLGYTVEIHGRGDGLSNLLITW